jgi:thiol-disulfide isomerase/thioredoxin
MRPLETGEQAPPVEGGTAEDGPRVVVFYKVTCPTCQIAAPVIERLYRAFPDRFVAVGQDPREKLDQFAEDLGTLFPAVPDERPFRLSDAYGVRTVPTVFLLDDHRVADVVESWDRDGWNRVAAKMGALTGASPETLSWEGDGLPSFRPG